MSIRSIYVYFEGNLLFQQLYPIIEKEVKKEQGNAYYPLPNAQFFQDYIREENCSKRNNFLVKKEIVPQIDLLENNVLNLNKEGKDILGVRDFDMQISSHALSEDFYVKIEDKTWLFVKLRENNFTLFIFPKEDMPSSRSEENIFNNSNFYATVEFGRKFVEFIKKSQFGINNSIENLEFVLLNCVPYGRILSDNFSAYLAAFNENKVSSVPLMEYDKVPSHQNKLLIQEPVKKMNFILEENIVVYQFNKEGVKDFSLIEGRIKGKVEHTSDEEISFVISNLNEEIVKNIALKTNGIVEKSIVPNQMSTKITFSIPDEKNFDICHYSLSNLQEIPIKGNYFRKQLSETQFSVRIELNLLNKFKNFIKDLKIQLQLDPSKSIISTDLTASHGKFEIIQSKSLLWRIPNVQDINEQINIFGSFTVEETKLNEKKSEVSLEDYLKLLRETNGLTLSRLEENDILFSMPDKFIQVEFEMNDSNISGLNISQNQVVIFPTRKLDIKIQKTSYPKKYFIFLNDDSNLNNFTNFVY